MSGEDETYELYAIRYAMHEGRTSNECFIFHDPHDTPMPLAYYVWLARSPRRSVLIDLGYHGKLAAEKKHTYFFNPGEGFRALGVAPADVKDVVVTHMHWDHVGNFDLFPEARIHVQASELGYCCSKFMQYAPCRRSFRLEDVTSLISRLYGEKVAMHEGDVPLFPGLSLHLIGGHSMGLQVVRVRTRVGWMVVASDALHFYRNFEDQNPFPTIVSLPHTVDGWHRALQLAEGDMTRLIPGHDPLVFARYEPVSGAAHGMAVRLDVKV